MFKFQKIKTIFCVLIIGMFFVSCQTESETAFSITTFPTGQGSVLYGSRAPVKIMFSIPMKTSVDALLYESFGIFDHNFEQVMGTLSWDNNALCFTPLQKWKAGEKYYCRLNGNLPDANGNPVNIALLLIFFTVPDINEPEDAPPPEIIEVKFLKNISAEDDYLEEIDYDSNGYWNNIIEGDCALHIAFSREMDFTEIERYIQISPYRNYDINMIDNKTIEICFSQSETPVKKLEITIRRALCSIDGIEMEKDYSYCFTEWQDTLQLPAVIVLQEEEYGDDGLPLEENVSFLVGAEEYEDGIYGDVIIIDFTFKFANILNSRAALDMLSKIILIPEDERISELPDLMEVNHYSIDIDQTWKNMEFGTLEDPHKYKIVIPGGIDGINDGEGHYIFETKEIHLEVVNYDELL